MQDVRGMTEAIERREAALDSLRSNWFVVVIIIIAIIICDSVKSSSSQTYMHI